MSLTWKEVQFAELTHSKGGLYGDLRAAREWLVLGPKTLTPEQVRTDSEAPKLGDAYPYNSQLKCMNVHIELVTKGVYRVRAEYQVPEIRGRIGGMIFIVPVERPPSISWSTYTTRKICERDLYGIWIKNSARDNFDPPLEVDWAYPQVTVELAVLEVPVSAWSYLNAINSTTWNIDSYQIGERKAKIVSMSLSEWRFEEWQGQPYGYRIFSYTALLNSTSWQPKVLDCGFRERVGGELRQIVLPNGLAPTSPVLLDGQGRAQLHQMPQPVFLEFTIFPELDFNDLPP